MKYAIPAAIILAFVLCLFAFYGCAPSPEASARRAVTEDLHRPDAKFRNVRRVHHPDLGPAVCGVVITGPVERRFIAVLTSDGAQAFPVFEGLGDGAHEAFSAAVGPVCS